EVDGDVLRLRDHADRLVEDRSRAVAALLDVRRERGADEDSTHLFRDRAERAPDHLQLDVHRRSTHVPSSDVSPCQPTGTQHVAPGSSRSAGPSTLYRSVACNETSGPGVTSAVRTATSSISRSGSACPYRS